MTDESQSAPTREWGSAVAHCIIRRRIVVHVEELCLTKDQASVLPLGRDP